MRNLSHRQLVLRILFGAVLGIFSVRLFVLQVVSSYYADSASRNATKRIVLEPTRGIIYDRSGKRYVTNTPIYDLSIVPSELVIPDTTLLERHLGLTRDEIRARIAAARAYSPIKPSLFEKHIDARVFAPLQEHLWQLKGMTAHVRNTREYLYPVGAGLLGYISEVDKRDIERSGGYYQQGDLIGRTGIERQYESVLRGQKGVKMVLVDARGREVGPYAGGRYDTIPDKGEDLVITIDAELQAYGEALMRNKRGSIVAIEPKTGEVLAFVSAPTYDPNLLTGMRTSANFQALSADSLLPLFIRPLQATYPPGSIFKLLNAITALEVGTLTPYHYYGCAAGFLRNGGRPGCHLHPTPLTLMGAIQHSCNAYFAGAYVDLLYSDRFGSTAEAYATWRAATLRYGVGHRLGIDIPNEKSGFLPTNQYYDKLYGGGRWKGMTIVSNSIGQGEILMTPLQMANVAALIANGGYYVQPHFLKQLYNDPSRKIAHFDSIRAFQLPAEQYAQIVDAMELVVKAGTGTLAAVPGVTVCGKTGTAENPHGADHAVFFAFAPKENPTIALAVIVENSGFGGTWAAPVASLLIEKYLTRTVTQLDKEAYIKAANFLKPGFKTRKAPRQVLQTATPATEPVPTVPATAPTDPGTAALPPEGD
ncbi:MAG: penicillin-binding transpeptidase domain-containing protein [Bacteroidia bacterium]|nr:penicillin-binding transpeptidase domain-containing protein [Bacteroidia bacterium]